MKPLQAIVYTTIYILAIGYGQNNFAAPKADTFKQFDREVLMLLLSAELALNRDQPYLALNKYVKAARVTQDSGIAEYATELAIDLEETQKSIAMAKLWAELAQQDIKPQLIVATLLLSTNNQTAIHYLTRAFNIEPSHSHNNFLAIYGRLSDAQRAILAKLVNKIAISNPNNAFAHLACGEIYAQQADAKKAETCTNSALKIASNLTAAITLKARLINYKSNEIAALSYLRKQLNHFKKDNQLRIFYASALIDNNQESKAIKELRIATADTNYAGEAYSLLGNIYFSQANWSKAEYNLLKASNFDDRKAKSFLLLGEIAENRKDLAKAIDFYSQISFGEHYLSGQLNISRILVEQGQIEEALRVVQSARPSSVQEYKILKQRESILLADNGYLDQSLELLQELLTYFPQEISLYFNRAIIYNMIGESELFEKDLNIILNLEPNNADALNALAYSFTNKPKRYEEGIIFANKAVSLEPKNADFLDTLGWLYYLNGNYQEALVWLYKAIEEHAGPATYARLGEVLWRLSKVDEAMNVWSKGLIKSPNHQALLDTLEKLNVDAKKLNY